MELELGVLSIERKDATQGACSSHSQCGRFSIYRRGSPQSAGMFVFARDIIQPTYKSKIMRLFGNILWHFPFFGFITALLTFLIGLLFTILIIPSPIGLGLIQFSKFLLAPYSYSMVSKADLNIKEHPLWKTFSTIIMILYFPIGLIIAFCAAIQVGLLFLSIIGIPAAIPIAKSLGVFLNPVRKVCVPIAVSNAVQARKEQEQVSSYLNQRK